jgi:hypothetical protein
MQQQGSLTDDKKKPINKGGKLGPLEDRGSALPPAYGGRTVHSGFGGSSWRSTNSNSMGDSLGKAASDWKLPPASVSAPEAEASLEKGDIWKSSASNSARMADSSTVTTSASTISTTDSARQGMSASGTTTKFTSMQPETVYGMRHEQPETISVQKEATTAASSVGSITIDGGSGGGSHHNINPYKGTSFKLNKTSSVPKAALHSVYGRPPRRKVISQENYYTWHNSDAPHLLKFTSIFCCPLTGECFASGRYGDPAFYYQHSTRSASGSSAFVTWYNKKALAEHGAAARAFDCIASREYARDKGIGMIPETLGADVPYAYEQSPPLLDSVPDHIRQAIQQAQEGIFNNTKNQSQGGDGSTKVKVETANDEGGDSDWFSRSPNDTQTSKDPFG